MADLGNLAGFASVLVLTVLMRLTSMHAAYPVAHVPAVMVVQVLAARLLFRETKGTLQWVGAGLMISGIMLISARG